MLPLEFTDKVRVFTALKYESCSRHQNAKKKVRQAQLAYLTCLYFDSYPEVR